MLQIEDKRRAVEFIVGKLGMLNLEHNTSALGEIINKLEERNFPSQVAADLVYLKIDLMNEPDYIICNLIEAFDSVAFKSIPNDIASLWFSKDERASYSQPYEAEIFSFPLKYNMIQVDEDQMWIGAISARDLMRLKDAQLIYYNENTQRKLRHVLDSRAGVEYYTIDIKQSSINSIQNLMLNGTYIADAIVLNMPEDTDYYYTVKTNQLVIKNINHFDIIDGYHRYRAISNLCTQNKDFNYMMQIQIVKFSESKAQQFMWQKDQQTKLRKLDSETLNQDNMGTRVVQRLNEDPGCNLYGKISRNSKVINSIELANIIQCVFFNGSTGVKNDIKKIIDVTKTIKRAINDLTEIDPERYPLNSEWDYIAIVILVFTAYTVSTRQPFTSAALVIGEFDYLKRSRVMRKVDATRIAKSMGVNLNV